MVDGADAEGWSEVASGWSELWGAFALPAQRALIAASGIGPGTRVLDAGCGTGEFLAVLREVGADPIGVDPASGMRELAEARGFTVKRGDAEHLPLADASVEVVTAVNALHFADDTTAALREFARVLVPGGLVAVANWAEHSSNDVDVIERALAEADGDEPPPDGPLSTAGGLEAAVTDAGLRVVASGVVDTPWRAADDDTLIRGILLGEDAAGLAERGPTVIAAAEPFRDGSGYLLRNAFRWVVAKT
ncbi:class I SAM-dependent methyltransferase [Microbacterium sp. P04]|uniref:class I SAM-dependent methyltransferase n=1 Tax=Microbacterium sp. P04 TaxID=3366947 RepID=UPI003746A5A4